jgi:hypothetical protein
MAEQEKLGFLPWMRTGFGVAIVRPDDAVLTGTAIVDAKLSVDVTQRPGDSFIERAEPTLTLVDPGDIIGLASQSVIRTFPVANESDAEYIPFAHIEFDQMDLPWRYSPGRHVGNKLRPWLTLVVFSEEDGEGTIAPPGPGKPLPVANLSVGVLPDKQSEAWAWAHGQVTGVTIRFWGGPGAAKSCHKVGGVNGSTQR